jgi:hypothetical protein
MVLGGGTGGKAESDGTLPSSIWPQNNPPAQITDNTPRAIMQAPNTRLVSTVEGLPAFNCPSSL